MNRTKYGKIERKLEDEVGASLKDALKNSILSHSERKAAEETSRNVMEKSLREIARAEVSRNAVEIETGIYYRKVHINPETGGVTIFLPPKIISELHLDMGKSCKWEKKGDALVMTPLEGISVQTKIFSVGYTFMVVIPDEMRLAKELKVGDYVRWKEEKGQLSLTKSDETEQDARIIYKFGNSIATSIPKEIVKNLKIYEGMPAVWTFDRKKLWLELAHENPNITLVECARRDAYIPKDMRGFFKKGDTAILQVNEGKLYVRVEQ
jgi:antitoxin component of MazEF toxin-antitoxin module